MQFLLQHNSRKSPNLYALDDLHPLCLAVGHSDINCFKLLINYGFDPDELFYDDTGRCGTLLCFGPSYQVAEYILEQGLLDLTRAYNPAPGKLDPMVECLNATGNISKLSQVLLTYGARIEDNAKFWKQILNTKLNSACSKFRCVSALYFMTKCGCELKKVFTFVRMEEITIPAYRIHRPALTSLRPDGVGVLSLYMLLTPNIKNQETLVEERVYPEASRVFQQIEGGYSHYVNIWVHLLQSIRYLAY